MQDFIFAALLLLTSFGVGVPFSLLLPASIRARHVAAPPLGFGAIAVLDAAAYRFGLSISATAALLSILAASMTIWQLATVLRFPSARTMAGGITAAAALLLVLCLLPKWTGGAQFASFQGNVYDQLSYLTQAVYFRIYDYAFLQSMRFDGLDMRPPVCVVFAAFAELMRTSLIERSYAYVAALQALIFFPATFVFLNLFRCSVWLAVLGAAALTLGFPMQYVVDINSWTQLAAMPNAVLSVGLAAIFLAPDEPDTTPIMKRAVRWMGVLGPLAASLFYTYPEITVPYGAALIGMVVFWFFNSGAAKENVRNALENLAIALASVALGLLGTIYLNDTIKYLIDQSTDVTNRVYWHYFQGYLFGPQFPGTVVPINFGLSLIGLYPILPQPHFPQVITSIWYLADFVLLLAILSACFLAWMQHWRASTDLRPWLLLSATVAGSTVPLALFSMGAFWAAGKGVTMLAPLFFFVLSAPILFPEARSLLFRISTVLFWAVHLIFGLIRPIAAMNAFGIHYPPPYPSIQETALKSKLSWDLAQHREEFKSCRGITLNLGNPLLRRYLQLYLIEIGVPWSSTDPLDVAGTYNFPIKPEKVQNPDCVIDNKYRSYPSQTVINLSADKRFENFVHAGRGSLEVGVDPPNEAEVSGMYPVEIFQGSPLRWTSAVAHIELPIDPEAPPKSLILAIWPLSAGRPMKVTVNDSIVYDGPIPPESLPQHFQLGEMKGQVLTIDFAVEPVPATDLGVALRELVIAK